MGTTEYYVFFKVCESVWKQGLGPGLYLLNVSKTDAEIYSYVNCDPNSNMNQSAVVILYRCIKRRLRKRDIVLLQYFEKFSAINYEKHSLSYY